MIKMSFKNSLLSICTLIALSSAIFAADPGSAIPTGASNDQQPGSVLVYNFYTSNATTASSSGKNTKITVTNTSNSQDVAVRLFFIAADGSVNGSLSAAYICLVANQTTNFLVSDADPGVTGYIIAVASDMATGMPISFNFLVGSEYVIMPSGHDAKLNAEGYQALFQGPLAPGQPPAVSLDFDGVKYSRAARVLALEHIPSREDGNRTMLVVNSLSGNVLTGVTPIGQISGILYDDGLENVNSFMTSGGPQFNQILSNDFPITTPKFTDLIPSQRSGWLKLFAVQDHAISGAAINFTRRAPGRRSAFNGGSNLHHLTNTTGASSLTIPVVAPNC